MKKVTLQIMASVFVTMSIVLASCSKEGPAGPAGAQGSAGPTGAQGPAGAKGDPGTANVIYSDWLDVTFDNGLGQIDVSGLSLDILNSGVVKVYWNLSDNTDPFIVSVPCTVPAGILFGDDVDDTDPPIYVDAYFAEQMILLSTNYNISSQGGISQFRYILIPGGTPVARKSSSIDWNNYSEVKKLLNLKD